MICGTPERERHRQFKYPDSTKPEHHHIRVGANKGFERSWLSENFVTNTGLAPRNLRVFWYHQSLDVNWDPPAGLEANQVESYQVDWRASSESYASERSRNIGRLSNRRQFVDGLDNDTGYTVRVRMVGGDG